MDILKKSFKISSDAAQMLDDYISKNQGMSLTLIVNSALKGLIENGFSYDPKSFSGNSKAINIAKTANIDSKYCESVEKIIFCFPGLSFTAAINFALFEWLKKPSFVAPEPLTQEKIEELYMEDVDLMDELAK